MPRTRPSYKNRLLAAFPRRDIERYFSDLTPVSLALRDLLLETGKPIENVFFIEDGVAWFMRPEITVHFSERLRFWAKKPRHVKASSKYREPLCA